MSVPRDSACSIVLDGELWVLGGVDEKSTKLQSVEVWNPQLNTWRTSPSFRQPRYLHVGGVVGGSLVVAGGYGVGCAYLASRPSARRPGGPRSHRCRTQPPAPRPSCSAGGSTWRVGRAVTSCRCGTARRGHSKPTCPPGDLCSSRLPVWRQSSLGGRRRQDVGHRRLRAWRRHHDLGDHLQPRDGQLDDRRGFAVGSIWMPGDGGAHGQHPCGRRWAAASFPGRTLG